MLRKFLIPTVVLAIAIPFWVPGAYAKDSASLVINQVDGSRFPTTQAYTTVLSDKGYPITGLQGADFQVLENGMPAKNVAVTTAVDADEPLAAILVLDTSGSMSGDAMGAEKSAAISFVESLRPQDQVGVIAFSTEVRTVQGLTEDKDAASAAIQGLVAGGNTALYDALYASAE